MLQGNDLTLRLSSRVTLSKSPDLSEPLCKRRLRIAVLASTYQMLPGTQQYFKCIPRSKSVPQPPYVGATVSAASQMKNPKHGELL